MSHLRAWRKRNGVTQEDLAKVVAVDRAFLSSIESGKKSPSVQTAKKIEAATGGDVTAASLLGLNDKPKRNRRGVREDSASFDYADKPWRKPVTVSLDVPLTAGQLEDYRKYLPDLEAIAAEGAREAMREAYLKAWNEANREAIEAHTKWIEKHGTFHDQFGEW